MTMHETRHDRNELGEPPSDGNVIEPLPGESGIPDVAVASGPKWSRKGLLAVVLFAGTVAAVGGAYLGRLSSAQAKHENGADRPADRPAAATAEPRRLDLAPPRIPAVVATPEETAEPIGVRRTGSRPAAAGPASIPPEDAPILLVTTRPGETVGWRATRSDAAPGRHPSGGTPSSTGDALDDTRRNLEAYQRQLRGLMDTLTHSTAAATGSPTGMPQSGSSLAGMPSIGGPRPGAPAGGGLFGGQLQGSGTPRVAASFLGNRSLTLPKGTSFTCALKTRVVSATSGFVGCQVQRNVYGDDGRVLLIERGSHIDGEYRIASVRPGTVRIPVLWTRVRTPEGVTVDLDSPGTGALGESGIDGHVDNRWPERIGAAMLLSLIDDSVKLVIQNQANESASSTVVLPSTTASTSRLAEKVLDSTINIPPLIQRNQGGIVGVYVARDVDFSSVYELQAVAR